MTHSFALSDKKVGVQQKVGKEEAESCLPFGSHPPFNPSIILATHAGLQLDGLLEEEDQPSTRTSGNCCQDRRDSEGKPVPQEHQLLHNKNKSRTAVTITRSRSTSAAPPRSSSAFSLSLTATPASTPLRPVDLDADCVRALVQREEEQLRLKKHQSFDTSDSRDWSTTAANIMASTGSSFSGSSSIQSGGDAAGKGKSEKRKAGAAAGSAAAATPSSTEFAVIHNVAQSSSHHNQSTSRAVSSQAGSSQTRATFHSHASSHEGGRSSSSSAAAGRDRSQASGIIRSPSAWLQRKIHLRPQLRGVHLITDELLKQIPELGEFLVGLVHIQVMHTSASLALNEVRVHVYVWIICSSVPIVKQGNNNDDVVIIIFLLP